MNLASMSQLPADPALSTPLIRKRPEPEPVAPPVILGEVAQTPDDLARLEYDPYNEGPDKLALSMAKDRAEKRGVTLSQRQGVYRQFSVNGMADMGAIPAWRRRAAADALDKLVAVRV